MKTKENMLAALHRFISQRSGMDYADYGEREAFMADYRPMLQAGRDARMMARKVELSAITADDLLAAAGNGRLQFVERNGELVVDYTVGQYFPTEYRIAACRLLSSVIWAYFRDLANPATDCKPTHHQGVVEASDYIRRQARLEFGRGLAKRWFN